MSTDTVNQQLVDAILAHGTNDRYFDIEGVEGWEMAEDDSWTQDCKYQFIANVVRHVDSGRCFCVQQGRTGSYHTDWYYDSPTIGMEVRLVEKVVTTKVWEAV
jgi:hypothetical protein